MLLIGSGLVLYCCRLMMLLFHSDDITTKQSKGSKARQTRLEQPKIRLENTSQDNTPRLLETVDVSPAPRSFWYLTLWSVLVRMCQYFLSNQEVGEIYKKGYKLAGSVIKRGVGSILKGYNVKILVLYLIRKDFYTTVPVVNTKLQNTIHRC